MSAARARARRLAPDGPLQRPRTPGSHSRARAEAAPAAARLRSGAVDAGVVQHVQRSAGNAAAATLVQRRSGKNQSRRERAKALGAPEARLVVGGQLPAVLPHLEAATLQHLQDIIDARVINPDAQARWSAVATAGRDDYTSAGHDRREREENEIAGEMVPVDPHDRAVKIDAMPLVDQAVFKPTVDNPDEAKFLDWLRSVLQAGVWLILGDEPFPKAWLSLTPEPDGHYTIPASGGLLTRDALMNTGRIGAKWYEQMQLSPHRQNLNSQAQQIRNAIENGRSAHEYERHVRAEAKPLVVPISDWLGDADFPPLSMWDGADEIWMRGWKLLLADETEKAWPLLFTAAAVTERCSKRLQTYVERTTHGAARAVKVASVVVVASAATLAILGGVELLAAGEEELAAANAVRGEIEEMTDAELDAYIETNRGSETVEWVPQPKGTTSRGWSGGRGGKGGSGLGQGNFL